METTISSKDRGTFKFTWHGGAYIDISRSTGTPFDVINVYDYAKGEVTLGKKPGVSIKDEVRKLGREWIRECADDFIRNGY